MRNGLKIPPLCVPTCSGPPGCCCLLLAVGIPFVLNVYGKADGKPRWPSRWLLPESSARALRGSFCGL
jgi:hypothetical protein